MQLRVRRSTTMAPIRYDSSRAVWQDEEADNNLNFVAYRVAKVLRVEVRRTMYEVGIWYFRVRDGH